MLHIHLNMSFDVVLLKKNVAFFFSLWHEEFSGTAKTRIYNLEIHDLRFSM